MSNARSCPFCGLVDGHTDNCYFTLKLEGATIGVIRAAWNRRAPVSTPQQSAQRASVDTPEFNELLESFANWQDQETFDALIAHINAWGSGARNSALEEAAKICDETWVCPGDLETESCHEAASKIRGLAAPLPAPQGEQA